MMRSLKIAGLLAAAVITFILGGLGVQFAPAQDHSFYTPGNATVGGQVMMCIASSGNAVPCGGNQVTNVIGGIASAGTSIDPDSLIAMGTCSSACSGTTLLEIDTLGGGYGSIETVTTAVGSGATLDTQESDDGVNWVGQNCFLTTITGMPTYAATNPSFANSVTTCPILGRFFRLQFLSYGSGTYTAIAYARHAPSAVYVNGVVLSYPNPYPGNAAQGAANPIVGVASGSTGFVNAQLAGVANRTTYLCGFSIVATGGAAPISPATAGTLQGNLIMRYQSVVSGAAPFTQNFNPCIPANTSNTPITVGTTADGTASEVDINVWGYQL